MFFKIGVLKNFANYTGEYLCWSLFLIKLQPLRPTTLLKRDFSTGCFLVKFAKFLKTPFFTYHFQCLIASVSGLSSFSIKAAWEDKPHGIVFTCFKIFVNDWAHQTYIEHLINNWIIDTVSTRSVHHFKPKMISEI